MTFTNYKESFKICRIGLLSRSKLYSLNFTIAMKFPSKLSTTRNALNVTNINNIKCHLIQFSLTVTTTATVGNRKFRLFNRIATTENIMKYCLIT